MRIETTIGGVPVLADAVIGLPDPDVGIPGIHVADLEISWMNGNAYNLKMSDADEDRICDEILEYADSIEED